MAVSLEMEEHSAIRKPFVYKCVLISLTQYLNCAVLDASFFSKLTLFFISPPLGLRRR